MLSVVAKRADDTSTCRVREMDRTTLERCRQGDPMAFRAFVVRHERAVFALLCRMMGRGPWVQELAQETFLRAFRGFSGFDPDGEAKPITWLLTIATRLALDARKRRGVPLGEGDGEVAAEGTPESEWSRAEVGRQIAWASEQLSDDQRAIWLLVDVHDLTVVEAARAIQIPENTGKARLHRARTRLRELLGPVWREEREG